MTPTDRAIAIIGAVVGAGLAALGWHAVAVLVVVAGSGVGVCRVDMRERRIPTPLVAVTAAGVLVVAVVTAVRDRSPGSLANPAVGAMVLGGAFLLVHLVSPAGIGFGDVRLATALGAAANVATATWTGAFVVGAGAGVAAVAAMAIIRRRSVPFGPFLVAATLVVSVAAMGGFW